MKKRPASRSSQSNQPGAKEDADGDIGHIAMVARKMQRPGRAARRIKLDRTQRRGNARRIGHVHARRGDRKGTIRLHRAHARRGSRRRLLRAGRATALLDLRLARCRARQTAKLQFVQRTESDLRRQQGPRTCSQPGKSHARIIRCPNDPNKFAFEAKPRIRRGFRSFFAAHLLPVIACLGDRTYKKR
jgi:hypothetical protein